MRVLVTGGCRFIGAATVRALVDRGDRVLNLDRRRRSAPIPALSTIIGRDGYARLETDIADRSLMRAISASSNPTPSSISPPARTPILTASSTPTSKAPSPFSKPAAIISPVSTDLRATPSVWSTPFRRTALNPMRAMRRHPRRPTPTRAAAASLIESWSHAHALPLVSCVAGNVFGPWQSETAFLPQLVTSLAAGDPVTLDRGGATVRDWLPLKDFAAGLVCALTAEPLSRHDFSAGAERGDSDLAEAVCTLLDIRAPLPGRVRRVDLITITGDASHASPGPHARRQRDRARSGLDAARLPRRPRPPDQLGRRPHPPPAPPPAAQWPSQQE